MTSVLAYSCQKADSLNKPIQPNKIKITWGNDGLYADNDTLYLLGYRNPQDSARTLRRVNIRTSLYDSIVQVCRYHIQNPFYGKLDQSTCFSGTRISIALQSGAAIQSVEYNYLLDERQLPDTIRSLRKLFQLIPYSVN
jgi:hypothetical protein